MPWPCRGWSGERSLRQGAAAGEQGLEPVLPGGLDQRRRAHPVARAAEPGADAFKRFPAAEPRQDHRQAGHATLCRFHLQDRGRAATREHAVV